MVLLRVWSTNGWAGVSLLGLAPKLTETTGSILSISAVAPGHNSKIVGSVQSTGDVSLDEASWEKSKKEFEVQTLRGPLTLGELPAGAGFFPAAL